MVPMAGSQAGVGSQLGVAILVLGTERYIKDTGIKMAVGTPLLTSAIEMVYHLLHQWKKDDLLGDGTIALISGYHLDLRRQQSFHLCLMTAGDLSVLMAIALVLGIWSVTVLLEVEAVRRMLILIFPATDPMVEDPHEMTDHLGMIDRPGTIAKEMIDHLGMTALEMNVAGEIEMTGM